jgi:hypothetical protein
MSKIDILRAVAPGEHSQSPSVCTNSRGASRSSAVTRGATDGAALWILAALKCSGANAVQGALGERDFGEMGEVGAN